MAFTVADLGGMQGQISLCGTKQVGTFLKHAEPDVAPAWRRQPPFGSFSILAQSGGLV